MTISEWMTANPLSVTSDTPIMEAMHLLRERGFRRLPVVDDGLLVGIVTDRDLKSASASRASTLSVHELNYLLSKLVVEQVMKRPVLTVGPDAPIEKAATLMAEHKVSGLPVVRGDDLLGVITITDILHAFVEILKLNEGRTLLEAARD